MNCRKCEIANAVWNSGSYPFVLHVCYSFFAGKQKINRRGRIKTYVVYCSL